ncbi:MAG TPA: DinB family protein [Candidatus Acidoferrales bacterium]|nr:DinB family protein [Candidatus Acidoferrales bacterium]
MTYYGSKELAASFRTVRNNTLTIAQEIPEDKYSFSAAPGCRTVAQTLVHIAVVWRLQNKIHITDHVSDLANFDFFGFLGPQLAEEQVPRTKQQIIDLLKSEGDKAEAMLAGMSEALLGETVSYPPGMTPPTKSRFEMVMAIKEHEMHHRGQLMVAERMLGIKPHLTRHMEERIAAMQAAAGKA